jgi:hypothetical protein
MLSPKPTSRAAMKWLLMEHLSERKYSICSCDCPKIVSLDEANAHRRRGHDVWDYFDLKAHQIVN